MKTFLLAAATVVVLGAPAFANDQGMTAGSEARGEPMNSSFHMSAKEPGRYTPGAKAHAKVVVKKKVVVRHPGSAVVVHKKKVVHHPMTGQKVVHRATVIKTPTSKTTIVKPTTVETEHKL